MNFFISINDFSFVVVYCHSYDMVSYVSHTFFTIEFLKEIIGKWPFTKKL